MLLYYEAVLVHLDCVADDGLGDEAREGLHAASQRGPAYVHSKLKTGVKSTRKSRVETLRRLAEPVLATSGSQPRIRWETGIPMVML